MTHKHFLVLEGPAGAGKTRRIAHLLKGAAGDRVQLIERPPVAPGFRFHGNEKNPMLMDAHRLIEGLYAPSPVLLIDRFWVSSLIYQPMKGGPGPEYFPKWNQVRDSLLHLVMWLANTVVSAYRRDDSLNTRSVSMAFHLILPTAGLLVENRSRISDRGFPFDPVKEITYYQTFAENASRMVSGCATVNCVVHRVRSCDDYAGVDAELVEEVFEYAERDHLGRVYG